MNADCEIAQLVDDKLYVCPGQLAELFTEAYGNEYEDVLQRIVAHLDSDAAVLNLTGRGIRITPEKTEEQLPLVGTAAVNGVVIEGDVNVTGGPISAKELGEIFAGSPLAEIYEKSQGADAPPMHTSSLSIDGHLVEVLHRSPLTRVYHIRGLVGAVYDVWYNPDHVKQVLIANRQSFGPNEVIKHGDDFYATSGALAKIVHGLSPIAENQSLMLKILQQYEANPEVGCVVDFFGNPIY
jgi:hypothetical protein